MNKNFSRKIYTFKLLLHDLKYLAQNIGQIISVRKNKEINRAFTEKIMTVVTAVNGCTYCTWFHAKQALSSGISPEEITNMLNLQFGADATEFEYQALLYAQHFAETDRNPEPEITEKLYKFYGEKTAFHIILLIRIIYFGNLSGNTFDAFISRLKGKKATESNFVFELIFFILNAPILAPLIPFTKKYRKK